MVHRLPLSVYGDDPDREAREAEINRRRRRAQRNRAEVDAHGDAATRARLSETIIGRLARAADTTPAILRMALAPIIADVLADELPDALAAIREGACHG